MKQKDKVRIAVTLILGCLVVFVLLGKKTCNKKGSLAEKINWAGKNCSRSK